MAEGRHKMLEKALQILELIAKEPDGMSFTTITNALEMPKSSAHSLISTFESMGYLDKDEYSSKYKIGLKAFEIGCTFSENDGFYTHVNAVLKELVDEIDETAHLATLDGTDVVYINKRDCSHAVRMISHIGKRVPAHATAIGKAILASKTDQEILELYTSENLPALTSYTINSRSGLIEELHRIRERGISTEKEESTPGIQCLALHVENDKIQSDIAISIAVPISRAGEGMERFEQPILRAKEKLQKM